MVKKRQITIDLESLSEEVIYKYGDYHAGFRELLQNAVDAIQDYKDYHRKKDKKFQGNIKVSLDPLSVTVIDNGIGLASKDIDHYLLKLYGTDKKGRERAGIFGRGFFAIFKEAKEVYVFTQRPKQEMVYLKVYPDQTWFGCEELTYDEIPPRFRPFSFSLRDHGTCVVAVPKNMKFPINEIQDYLESTCRFFELPLSIDGARVNKTFKEAVERSPLNRAIVDFDVSDTNDPKKRITGCLAYQTSNNMIQAFVHRIKVLNLISPVDSVCGYINYDQLQVVPSRDALVQNESYHFFIRVLTQKCDEVMKELAIDPQKDDFQALLNYAIAKNDPVFVWNVPLYQASGRSEKISIENVIELAKAKEIIFFSEKRSLIVDRLRKRDYVVLIDCSDHEFRIVELVARRKGIQLSPTTSEWARKMAGLGNRILIPEEELSGLEKKILLIVRDMTNLKAAIMVGDEIDEAEHIQGEIRLQRNSKVLDLARKLVRNHPFICKLLLGPLIAHEISHENGLEVHDEQFYDIFEANLRDLNDKIIKKFLQEEIKKLHNV